MNKEQIIAKLQSKLVRQNAALAETLAELDILEKHGSKDPTDQIQIQYSISLLNTKRLRQSNAVKATEGYLKVLQSTIGRKTP